MALHQHHTAQNLHGSSGHANRSGLTQEQPEGYSYEKSGTFPKPPAFEDKFAERDYLKGRLAAAYRIFGQQGFDEGAAGHITVRDPVEPNTLWVNPFGVAFSQMRKSDLLRIDHTGKVLEGGTCKLINRAAVLIHVAIHEARPDVMCAAHSHAVWGRALSALRMPLLMTSQDSTAFYNDVALFDRFEGVVVDGDEGLHIAQAIGQKKAIYLANHGILTTGCTVEETVYWFYSLNRLSQVQLSLMAAVGGDLKRISVIDDDVAEKTYKNLGSHAAGWFSAKPLFDAVAQDTNESYLA